MPASPTCPGLRLAFSVLLTFAGCGLVGQAQTVTFAGLQTVVPTGSVSSPSGVAVDATGDIFVADLGNSRVVKVPAGCTTSSCVTTVGFGLSAPVAVASDRVGDVYIVDQVNGQMLKVPAGCTSSSCQVAKVTGLNAPTGVTVDQNGNAYVADTNNNQVIRSPSGCVSSSCQTMIGSGLVAPSGVAIDLQGDVFISDTGNQRVIEVPAGCTTSSCQVTVGSGFGSPTGIAVDIGQNVFVVDSLNDQVVKIPQGCTTPSCQVTVGSGLTLPQGVAVDLFSSVYIADAGSNQALQVQFTPNFSKVLVGSSNSATLQYNINVNVTLAANPSVVTQGVAGLDFIQSGISTCTGAQTAGSTCAVTVQFQPIAPGGRRGAVQLSDDSGNLLVSTLLRGLGQSSAVAFPLQGALTTLASGFATYGSAVDAGGNLFMVDNTNNRVLELPSGCTGSSCSKTVVSGLTDPYAIAIDGAGTLFIAEASAQLVEIPVGCASRACWTTVVLHTQGLVGGVALDLADNVLVGDSGLLEFPAGCVSLACRITVVPYNAPLAPTGVAVDDAGNAYYAYGDYAEKTPVGCFNYGCTNIVSIITAFGDQTYYGVAVDAAGDLFIQSNYGISQPIFEGCTDGSCSKQLPSPVPVANGFALDGAGDWFFSSNDLSGPGGEVTEQQNSQHAPVDFGAVNPGSAGTAQVVTVQNIGNLPLTFAGLAASANFAVDAATTTCSTASSLAPTKTCTIGVVCSPAIAGALTGALTLTDNGLNGSPATQQVPLLCAGGSNVPPPVITSANSASFAQGIFSSFTVKAVGYPAPHFSLPPLTALLDGLTFVDNGDGTATISGTPDVTGSFDFTITAQNGVLPNATQNFHITQTSAGIAPAISSSASATFSANEYGSFTVQASGSPTPVLSVAGALPAGLSFVDNHDGTATISGTPTDLAGGNYPLTLTAQSVVSPNATQGFVVTVQPTISLAGTQTFVDFSGVNVGSSASSTLQYTISSNITLNAPVVVTQGSAAGDYLITGTPTCTGAQTAPTTCSITVRFTPTAAGMRMGAVQIVDSTGAVHLTTYLRGVGLAPTAAFPGGPQTTLASDLDLASGVAVDSTGNVYIADTGLNQILKLPAGCTSASCQTSLGTGLFLPAGVAVDGAGNVLIADQATGQTLVSLAICGTGSCEPAIGNGLHQPSGVAVDAAGNAFIADTGNNRVIEVPPGCTSTTCQTTLGAGLNQPTAVAVDTAGDVFIADSGNGRVVEAPPGCAATTCQTIIATGLSNPQGVAVDAAGDVFVADSGNNQVLEIPAGCTSTTCQVTVGSGLNQPTGIAVDGAGDVYIADTGNFRVVEVQATQAAPLSFGSVPFGSTSTPQTVTVQNVGDQPLTFTSFTTGSGFNVDSNTTTCSIASALAPGASCHVGVVCSTAHLGSLASTLSLFDNTLNQSQGKQGISLSCTVVQASQTITFSLPSSVSAGTSLPLAGSASSGLAVSYSSSTPAVCSVTGSSANFLTNGTCTLTASQNGNDGYTAATPVTASTSVTGASQSITFTLPASAQVLTSLTLSGSASSGLTVTYTSSTPTVCSVTGSSAQLLTTGTCTIAAAQVGNSTYAAATAVTASTSVTTASQSITFSMPSSAQALTSLSLSGSASSGLAILYTSNTPTVCSVTGSSVQLLTAGTCTIAAAQAGNSTYAAATAVTASTSVTAASQSINFSLPASAQALSSLTLTGSASSGLAILYTSNTPTVCSVTGSSAKFLTTGTCTVAAAQSGNSVYGAATTVTASTSVTAASQSITFSLPASAQALSSLTLTGSASSGLAILYTSNTPAVCSVTGSSAKFLATGTCTIAAAQSGNGVYGAATPVSASTSVTAASQSITFSLPASAQALTSLTLTGSASSGLAILYTSNTPTVCSVTGSSAKFLTTGTCTIAAAQAGNSIYGAATPVTASTAVTKVQQSITFTLPASVPALTSLTLTGSASSGLLITYTSNTPAVCSVTGSSAKFLNGGTCTIAATQAGNSIYGAATPVTASTAVTKGQQSITFKLSPSSTLQGSTIPLSATATSGLPVSFTSLTPTVCSVSGSSSTLLQAGTCTLQAAQPGNASYAAANPVSQNVTVTAAFTITPSPKTETIRRGNIAAFVLQLQAASGFTGKVKLSCAGGPAASYCSSFPMTVSFQKGAALAVSGLYFPPSTPPGVYTITFTGTSGAVANTATAKFTVQQ